MDPAKQNVSVMEVLEKINDDPEESDKLKDQVFQRCVASWGRNGPASGKEQFEEKKNGVELMNYLIDTTLYGSFDFPRLPVFIEICTNDGRE